MSRIEEALRRAAEAQQAKDGSAEHVPLPVPPSEQSVEELAREPFPVEIGARRARLTIAPIEQPAPEAKTEDAPDPEQGARRRSSLFERLDARLAEKVVADTNMSPISREQYRRLAAMLHDAQGNSGLRVVMVASAVPGEGKTLTASNVALTLSESYRRRVLLIDADLRKPALHELFRLTTTSGLIDGLESPTEIKLVVRQVSSQLWVLPAGRPTQDPMAGLTSQRMRRVIEEAKESFDWIIIDTPPLMTLPDAHLLSTLVDGAILVVKAHSTPHELVKRTADTIGRNRVIGVVLNQAEQMAHAGYGAYYGGYYLAAQGNGTRS